MALNVDLSGNNLIVNDIYVGAATPGAAGTLMSGSEIALLDGLTAGTVAASKAVVVDANKDIGDFRNLDATNFDAGASGTAGTVDIFPSTAAKGKVALTAADSAGDTTTTIVNASQAGARTYTIPDAGASASFVMTEGAQTVNGNQVFTGTLTQGSDATDRVAIKGIYMTPAVVAVAVPTIANDAAENADSVAVNVASAFSMAPAVGDAVIAIPQEALPTDCLMCGAYVTATDEITVTFASKEGGGGVTGANKNFKFLVIDLT